MAAHFRYSEASFPDQPDAKASGLRLHKRLRYIVLRNVRGTIAVFRIQNDGQLRRLRRWPAALDE